MNDPINPNHYKTPAGGELVDMINHLNYCRGNAIKYIFRAGKKYPEKEIEDIQKAIWCLNKELELLTR